MTGIRGVLVGALTLVALETVLSTEGAADRTAGAFGTLAGFVTRLLDPTVAAIPDLAGVSDNAGGHSTLDTITHVLEPLTLFDPFNGNAKFGTR